MNQTALFWIKYNEFTPKWTNSSAVWNIARPMVVIGKDCRRNNKAEEGLSSNDGTSPPMWSSSRAQGNGRQRNHASALLMNWHSYTRPAVIGIDVIKYLVSVSTCSGVMYVKVVREVWGRRVQMRGTWRRSLSSHIAHTSTHVEGNVTYQFRLMYVSRTWKSKRDKA